MIPKIIHYVWFGDRQKTKKMEKCLQSWKKFCPDYEIIEWNESNFDINSNSFIKEAYDVRRFAFASDVARLMVLYEHGGIYVDADVEIIKSLDDLLDNEAFIGFEIDEYVNSGQILGCVEGNKLIKEHIEQYSNMHFPDNDDHEAIKSITCSKVFTRLLVEKGLKLNGEEQIIEGLHVYPQDYFNPYDYDTMRMHKTENSYSIHWSAHSWTSQSYLRRKIAQICHRLFGIHCFDWIKKIIDI